MADPLSVLFALPSFYKEMRNLLIPPADGLNFNIVTPGMTGPKTPGKHMRIVNLLPMAMCAVRFWVQLGEDAATKIPIQHLYHVSTDNLPYGERVIYKIPLTSAGIFLYPRAMYYVLCDELKSPNFNWDGDVRVQFFYSTSERGEMKGKLQTAVHVEASGVFPTHESTQRAAA